MKDCPHCIEREKPEYFGSDPKCAFRSGVFDTNNWQCATMNALRDLAEEQTVRTEDNSAAIIPILGEGGFILMRWYKERGRTENACVFFSDSPEPLTLHLARKALGVE